jgi:hypothetical protein
MCAHFPSCEPLETVLQRVAVEVGGAAVDLEKLELLVIALAGGRPPATADMERLQSFDRLGQHLRTLQAFLHSLRPCLCGRIDIDTALDEVWLESVRRRLKGAPIAAPAIADPELW